MFFKILWLALGACAQRIVGPINSDDPRWLSGNSGAPAETASLAFVFDTTGSMWDDLEKVQNGAQRILQSTRDRHIQPLYNYILVPFHDPEIGPVSRTRDPVEFQRELRNIRITGGGDCPEMSIYAIREALLLSLDNSYIYVFTDARAKDYNYLPEVLQERLKILS